MKSKMAAVEGGSNGHRSRKLHMCIDAQHGPVPIAISQRCHLALFEILP